MLKVCTSTDIVHYLCLCTGLPSAAWLGTVPHMQLYVCNMFGVLQISISAMNASLQSCADYYTACIIQLTRFLALLLCMLGIHAMCD